MRIPPDPLLSWPALVLPRRTLFTCLSRQMTLPSTSTHDRQCQCVADVHLAERSLDL